MTNRNRDQVVMGDPNHRPVRKAVNRAVITSSCVFEKF